MKSLPSSLNNILRARYLQEAVDTASPVSYRKRKDDITYSPRFAPTPQSIQPELTLPSASEFPRSESIKDYIERARKKAATSELSFIEPETPYVEAQQQATRNPRLVAATQRAREIETNRQRSSDYGSKKSTKSSPTLYSGFPPIPEEQISRAAQATKSGIEKAITTGKKMLPDVKSTLRGVPYQAAHLGFGYFPFVAGSAATDIESLPNDPIVGLDPVSFSGGMAAAEMATPYMVDLPLALARGAKIGQALKSTGELALAGLGRLPHWAIPYTMAYGTYQLQDWSRRENEPRFREMMQDYESEQAKLQTKRRKEGREESFGEALGRTMQLNDILQSYVGGAGHFGRPF